MTQIQTIRCPQCKVDVLLDKIDLPHRCHAKCPLNDPDNRSHGLPGSLGMNATAADLVRMGSGQSSSERAFPPE